MNEGVNVWLLPHPGDEREPSPRGCECPWPPPGECCKHKRKFLNGIQGRAVSADCKIATEQLNLWTEYEPPTSVLEVATPNGEPRFVHKVITQVPVPTNESQNTDPWVFHPGFVWSICRHNKIPAEAPAPGDIVLFGSSRETKDKDHRWVLDTVFVVAKQLDDCRSVPDAHNYQNLVASVLGKCKPFVGRPFESMDQPFSFAPCQRVIGSDAVGFPRPCINKLLEQLMKADGKAPLSSNSQSLTKCFPKYGLLRFWQDLVEHVFHDELLLGTSFELPLIVVSGVDASLISEQSSAKSKNDGEELC